MSQDDVVDADAPGPEDEIIEWREQLPPECPLLAAGPLEDGILVRLIGPADLSQADFDSYAALGYECNEAGKECQWAACSMFAPSVPRDVLKSLTKYKRLRNKNAVAFVQVSPAAGHGFKERSHVSVWMRKSFDPVASTINVVSLDSYEPTQG